VFFKDIIGQDNIKQVLLKSVKEGYIPHARLITGNEGVGKFALALAYSRYLCCTNRGKTDACGECPSCKKFNKLIHPDLHFVFPITNKKKNATCDDFLVEWRDFLLKNRYFDLNYWSEFLDVGNSQPVIYSRESDSIIGKLNLKAYESEYKIMIVWLPEKMEPECANSLLKVIEEPPAKTIFLLVSEMPDMVLGTIRSRSQLLFVPPIDDAAMKAALAESHKTADLENIVHLASGNYLRALKLLAKDDDNEQNLTLFKSIMRNAWTRSAKKMKSDSEDFGKWGRERQKAFFRYAGNYVRENFLYGLNLPEINYINKDESAFTANFAPYVTETNVVEMIGEFDLAERHIEANVSAKMIFFDLSMKIAVLLKKH
jgi:DNA polymerase-3 subunit delta'